MRKIIASIILSVVFAGCLSACGNSESVSVESSTETIVLEENETINKDVEKEQSESEEMINSEVLYISYSEDAMTFVTEEIVVDSVEPEMILKELSQKKVMDDDVEVLNLSVSELDGKKVMDIDLNDSFLDYLSTMGSTGEYYILGGLCNSFLQTYDCEKIKVTVNGEFISTGHNKYADYLMMFK